MLIGMETETNTTTNTADKGLIERLFSVGAHFGFTRSRRHPTAKPYIFANKQGTDIIDLEKSATLLQNAKMLVEEAGRTGKTVLFIGSKEEIKHIVEEEAKKVEMPFVVNRWVGGMLTNFSEIKKRIARLNDLVAQGESGELERKYTKKERVVIGRELNKLQHNFGGIQKMDKLPGMVIVVDPRHESIAVSEANQLSIPVVAVTSSDADLSRINHPVVVNDALQASVKLVLEELTSAYSTGKSSYVPAKKDDQKPGRRDR